MKKVTKKITSKVTGTPKVSQVGEVTSSETCAKCKVDKLTISFTSEDMNKVVEKINELVDKSNDSI